MSKYKTRKCLLIILLFSALAFDCPAENSRTIVILPFVNSGSIEYDNLRDLIPTYFFTLLKDLPGYEAVSHHKVKQYNDGYIFKIKSFDRESLAPLALDYGAHFIIRGEYTDAGSDLLVHCVIQTTADWNEDSKLLKGKIRFPITYTLDELFLQVIKSISSYIANSSVVSVNTRETCRLMIDGEYFGETPLRMRLMKGEHTIRISYPFAGTEEPIYEEKFPIEPEKDRVLDLNVFVPFRIRAGAECTVSIDGLVAGTTPFEKMLYTGREYEIKAVYSARNGRTITAYDSIISTREHSIAKDPAVDVYIPQEPVITVSESMYRLYCAVNNEEPRGLPARITLPGPGSYFVDVFIDDALWQRRWSIQKSSFDVLPFERIPIDVSAFKFEKQYLVFAIPGLPQFHNRETDKGTMLLSFAAGSLLLGGISAIVGSAYYPRYREIANAYNSQGLASGYTQQDVEAAHKPVSICNGLIVASIITLSAAYLASITDGIICMNRLDELLNQY